MTNQEVLAKVTAMASEFDALRPHVDRIMNGDAERYYIKTVHIIDELNNVRSGLTAMLDGRPRPFPLSEKVSLECGSPGHSAKVHVAGIGLDLHLDMPSLNSTLAHLSPARLPALRAWLESAKSFHNANPVRKPEAVV